MTRKQKTNPDSKLTSVLETALAKKLELLANDENVRVLIKMRKKPQVAQTRSTDSVVKTLQKEAKRAQRSVLDYLRGTVKASSSETKGAVKANSVHSFWLVNLVSAELNKAQIAEVAKLPGVVTIYEDRVFHVYHPEMVDPEESVWDNIGFVNAPEVWALGYRGQNVKVAVIDTGVDPDHPELASALGGEAPYHEGYWVEFDENGNQVPDSVPHDSDTHGTHVSGTAVGRNVNLRIGMAPEAIFGHVLALPQGSGTLPQLLAGMQWAVEHGFQVVNGSWGGSGLDEEFAEAVANMATAGVFPVFAIGNDGPDETGAPGNTPYAEAVGAFDAEGEIAEFSGGGVVQYPNYPYPEASETIKPDISAPGVAITSAVPGGGYEAYNGTSMASPHVTGAVALLLSKNPALTADEIRVILRESVGGKVGLLNDPGARGKDTRYGWGRLNTLKAIQAVPAPPTSGMIQGYLQGEDEFIAGGMVTLVGPETRTLTTDEHGFYEGILKEGDYQFSVKAMAYLPQTGVGPIAAEELTIRNFVLEAAPLGFILGRVRDTVTKEPLRDVKVQIPGTTVVTMTNEDGEFAIAIKEGKYRLVFTHKGYFPATVRNVEVRPDQTVEANVEMTFGKNSFEGLILDQETRLPLPYTFILVVETGSRTLADGDGRFTLDLPAGSHDLLIQRIGYHPLQQTVNVEQGQVSTGQFELEQILGTYLFASHFDTPDDWEEWNAEGGWHLTHQRAITPPNSVWHGSDEDGLYPNDQKAILQRKTALNIPADGITTLNFYMWGEIERNYDFFYVIVLQGEQREELYRYSNQVSQWQNVNLDLTPYAGKEIVLVFEFTSDYSVTGPGIFLDDVVVFHSEM